MTDATLRASDLRAMATQVGANLPVTAEGFLATADALDALREAVKGCGKPFNLDVRMESDVCVSTNRHCVSCRQAMWKAISRLLGTTDNGGVE